MPTLHSFYKKYKMKNPNIKKPTITKEKFSNSKKQKLIICIDGLGKDLISKENTPFLASFKNIAELETLFATTGIEYTFFTGQNPDKTGIWLEFVKANPSIFNNILLKISPKKIKNYIAAAIQYSNKRTWISGTHNIPKNKLKYFEPCVKQNIWKLPFFQSKSFSFYKWPFFIQKDSKNKNKKQKTKIIFKYENDDQRLTRILKSKQKEIYYTQLMSIDKTIHKFGKTSNQTKKAIKQIDKILKKHITKFLKQNPNAEIFLWSDHGFTDIKNCINIKKLLPRNKDYIYFIAGTTIHFWFKNKQIESQIKKTLSKITELKILDKKIAKKYNIPLDKKYGKLTYFVKKENYIFPNFYQKTEKEKFISMHDYPDNKELNGFLISNTTLPKKLKINQALKYLQ